MVGRGRRETQGTALPRGRVDARRRGTQRGGQNTHKIIRYRGLPNGGSGLSTSSRARSLVGGKRDGAGGRCQWVEIRTDGAINAERLPSPPLLRLSALPAQARVVTPTPTPLEPVPIDAVLRQGSSNRTCPIVSLSVAAAKSPQIAGSDCRYLRNVSQTGRKTLPVRIAGSFLFSSLPVGQTNAQRP
jgi:hypothetical protein